MKSILLISAPAQSAPLLTAIQIAGHRLAAVLTSFADLLRLGEAGDPDLIIVSVDALDDTALALLAEHHRRRPRPLVVFTQDASRARIEAAIGAGVDAYVIDGFSPERLNPIIDVATARFNEARTMQRKLVEAQDKLSERKLIERAKGMLMKLRGISEEDAFRALRTEAMDKNLRLCEVAARIIAVDDLLAPRHGSGARSKFPNRERS